MGNLSAEKYDRVRSTNHVKKETQTEETFRCRPDFIPLGGGFSYQTCRTQAQRGIGVEKDRSYRNVAIVLKWNKIKG